jgi:hypothetical protein
MSTDLASTSTTPNFVWFGADGCNNMEGGCHPLLQFADQLCCHQYDVPEGDKFIRNQVATIFNSAAWKTQRSVIYITWDEDYDNAALGIDNQGNNVPMIVIPSPHSGMRQGAFTTNSYYTHYSLLRTIEASLGLPPLTNNDKFAAPMNPFWP